MVKARLMEMATAMWALRKNDPHASGRWTRDYCLDYFYSRNVCKSRGWSLLLENQ